MGDFYNSLKMEINTCKTNSKKAFSPDCSCYSGHSTLFPAFHENSALKNDIRMGKVVEAKDIDEVRFMKMSLSDGTYENGFDKQAMVKTV